MKRGDVLAPALAMLCLGLPFAPAAAQVRPGEPSGGALVVLMGITGPRSGSDCGRRLDVRRVSLEDGRLVGNQTLEVCVASKAVLRQFSSPDGLTEARWSDLEKGDLLHVMLNYAYFPTLPLKVGGTGVVLVARDRGH